MEKRKGDVDNWMTDLGILRCGQEARNGQRKVDTENWRDMEAGKPRRR